MSNIKSLISFFNANANPESELAKKIANCIVKEKNVMTGKLENLVFSTIENEMKEHDFLELFPETFFSEPLASTTSIIGATLYRCSKDHLSPKGTASKMLQAFAYDIEELIEEHKTLRD